MILCATLNSCLDKTLIVPSWRPGDSVRGISTHEVVGGKGNNVARALARLGREPRPVTFLGGDTGRRCKQLLQRDDQLEPIVIPSIAETRVILTVRSDDGAPPTAFFDPDPAITSDEADQLVALIEQHFTQGSVKALTLSGSSPSQATHVVYAKLISLARLRGIPVFLDTYGPALEAVMDVWPDVLQLNRREAGVFLKKPILTDEDLFGLLDDWAGRGVRIAIVTDGPDALLFSIEGSLFRGLPPRIEPVNPVGSGDCMLAGLVDGWLAGWDKLDAIRQGIACAAANALVWDAAAIELANVQRLRTDVKLEPLERKMKAQKT